MEISFKSKNGWFAFAQPIKIKHRVSPPNTWLIPSVILLFVLVISILAWRHFSYPDAHRVRISTKQQDDDVTQSVFSKPSFSRLEQPATSLSLNDLWTNAPPDSRLNFSVERDGRIRVEAENDAVQVKLKDSPRLSRGEMTPREAEISVQHEDHTTVLTLKCKRLQV